MIAGKMLFSVAKLALLAYPASDAAEYTDKFGFWQHDYGMACSESISRDRPLFILFCELHSELGRSSRSGLFVSEVVEQNLRSNYVRLHVDLSSESGQALAKRFGVQAEPSFVILDRSTKWTMFEHGGMIGEVALNEALMKNRLCKLGANGKPLKLQGNSAGSRVAAMVTPASPGESVNTAGYRVALVRSIDESAFDREVIEQSKERTVVVDFWAEWCGPCRALAPILERQIRERGGEFVLVKVNVDQAPNLTARYRVESIPAVKIFRDGKPVFEFVGLQSDADLRLTLDRLRQTPHLSRIGEPEPTRR